MKHTDPFFSEQNDLSVRSLASAGMFAALTLLATSVLKIPTPTFGYIHIGDAFVLLAGVFLGPALGGLSAGLGSALSDLLGGYVIWAPGTFVIKFLTAFVCASLLRILTAKKRARTHSLHEAALRGPAAWQVLAFCGVIGEAVMTAGYFLFNILIVSLTSGSLGGASLASAAAVSLAEIPFNLVQGTAGVILLVLLHPVFARMHMAITDTPSR